MKKFLLITLLFLVIIIGILVGILNPAGRFGLDQDMPADRPSQVVFPAATPSETPSSAVSASVERAIKQEFYSDPEGRRFEITRIVVVGPYALSDWADENSGGVALYQEQSPGSWTLLATDGGAWSADDLVARGVPAGTAQMLTQTFSAP